MSTNLESRDNSWPLGVLSDGTEVLINPHNKGRKNSIPFLYRYSSRTQIPDPMVLTRRVLDRQVKPKP